MDVRDIINEISRKKLLELIIPAWQQQEKGNFADAICEYREIIHGLKYDKDFEETLARAFCLENLAKCYFRMKQYYEASEAVKKSILAYEKVAAINPYFNNKIERIVKKLSALSEEIIRESDVMF